MRHDAKVKPSPITLRTIAEAVGVSRTTVSNAYSRPDQLNPELRRKILQVAKELGYPGPHPAARTLRKGRAGVIGLLFPEAVSYAFTDPAAVLQVRGIAEATEQENVALLLLPAPPGQDSGPAAVRQAVVDSFIVYSVADDDPGVAAIVERRLPAVVIDGSRPGMAAVTIDDRGGARRAAEHLLALGHQRIALIVDRLAEDGYSGPAGPERCAGAVYPVARDRLAGYADAIRAAGRRWEDVPVEERPMNTQRAGYDAAAALLDRGPRPTAILAFSDQLALGALRAARDRGVRVPEALSIVGFDDVPEAGRALPALTTVRQPLLEKGRIAGRLALESWPPDDPPAVHLPTELIVRASTGPAPA